MESYDKYVVFKLLKSDDKVIDIKLLLKILMRIYFLNSQKKKGIFFLNKGV